MYDKKLKNLHDLYNKHQSEDGYVCDSCLFPLKSLYPDKLYDLIKNIDNPKDLLIDYFEKFDLDIDTGIYKEVQKIKEEYNSLENKASKIIKEEDDIDKCKDKIDSLFINNINNFIDNLDEKQEKQEKITKNLLNIIKLLIEIK